MNKKVLYCILLTLLVQATQAGIILEEVVNKH